MKSKSLALVAFLLAPVPAAAAEAAPTTGMAVTTADLQLYATAIRTAAATCGADREVGCQIGLLEKSALEKLNAAAAALAAPAAPPAKK